jgi:protein-tyrosine kinase
MNNRAGLIERAAALLRDGNAEASAYSRTEAAAEAPAPIAPLAPLSRAVSLDRNHLAQLGILMPWMTTSRVVEEFRIAKRNIMFSWQMPDYPKPSDRPPRVVLVTSSKPREGKTFCSINLALAFAAEEHLATILIDGDAMRADTAKTLGIPTTPGFTDILAGESSLQDAMVQTDLPNLIVLPSGMHGAQVPELLSGRGPNLLFAEIAHRYPEHVIIVDTPPCLASTDAAALAPYASQIMFVVEAAHTQRTEIETSLSLLSGCQQIRFLLNKTPRGSGEHFGSYSYHYPSG